MLLPELGLLLGAGLRYPCFKCLAVLVLVLVEVEVPTPCPSSTSHQIPRLACLFSRWRLAWLLKREGLRVTEPACRNGGRGCDTRSGGGH